MAEEKRKPRSYKSIDGKYNAAMKRAKREKKKLAQVMEGCLIAYADGKAVIVERANL